MKQKQHNKLWRWLAALLLTAVSISFLRRKKGTIKQAEEKIKEELTDLIVKEYRYLNHQWQMEEKKWRKAIKKLHDFFIPHSGNDHKPRALSPAWLKAYAALLIAVKLLVVGVLFFTYPNPARLSQQIVDQLFTLTNQSRIEAGVEPLNFDPVLTEAASAKARDMAEKGYFSHIGPDGKKPWQWIDRGRYQFVYMGENLAMDFSTAEVVHLAFKKSPSHWKNIVNPRYRDMGIGVASGVINGRETVVLVEFFGSRQALGPQLAKAETVPFVNEQAQPSTAPAQGEKTEKVEVAGTEIENKQRVDNASAEKKVEQPADKSLDVTASQAETAAQPVKKEVKTESDKQTPVKQQEEIKVKEVKSAVAVIENSPGVSPVGSVEDSPQVAGEEMTSSQLAKEFLLTPEYNISDQLVVASVGSAERGLGLVDYVVIFSRYFFLVFVVVMLVLLLINILVKPHIQHSSVIIQTIAVIILATTMLLVRFHLVENLPQVIIY